MLFDTKEEKDRVYTVLMNAKFDGLPMPHLLQVAATVQEVAVAPVAEAAAAEAQPQQGAAAGPEPEAEQPPVEVIDFGPEPEAPPEPPAGG